MSVTIVGPANTAEPIEMSFELWSWVDPGNHVLDGNPDPHTCRGNEGESGRPRICLTIDALKATQQGAEPLRCGCRL